MNDPTIALLTGIRTKVLAAYSSAGITAGVSTNPSSDPPYTILGDVTVVEWKPNKTAIATEATSTLVSWSTTLTEAQTIAATALSALTDKDSPISVTGFSLSDFRLDFKGSPIIDSETDMTLYGVPLRIRYRITQTG